MASTPPNVTPTVVPTSQAFHVAHLLWKGFGQRQVPDKCLVKALTYCIPIFVPS